MKKWWLCVVLAGTSTTAAANGTVVGCAAGQREYCAARPRFPYPLTVPDLDAQLTVLGGGWGSLAARLRGGPPVKVVIVGGSMTCGGDVAKRDAWPSVLSDHLRRLYGERVSVDDHCQAATSLTWAVHKVSEIIDHDVVPLGAVP